MKRDRRNLKGEQPSNNGRCSSTGQFTQGNTYGKGRKQGSRNKASDALGQMFLDEHERITRQCVDLGLAGNVPALKLCLERLIPVVRDLPVNITLPTIDSVASASELTGTLLSLVASGAITPSQGEQLSRLTERHLKSLQLSDLEARLAELEQQLTAGAG